MSTPSTRIDSRATHDSTRVALRVVTLGLGIFFLFMSLNKFDWLTTPELLAQRFQRWLPNAAWYAQPYLRWVAIPGADIFARLVPIGEFVTALSMLGGIYTRPAAVAALFMVLNFHTATSSFSSMEFLRDGTGPLLFATLIAVAVSRAPLPFSLGRG